MSKRFTIAIIHRNGIDRLKTALDSVLLASSQQDEIIIIDNNSSDDSINVICSDKKYNSIHIIQHDCNAGYGYSCNRAMQSGSGKYFLLCNNDIELTNDCLNQFEALFNSDSKAGLIGPQMYSPAGKKMRSYGTQTPNMLSQLDLIGRPIKNQVIRSFSPVSILRGACLAVRKEMIDELGMYDEDFYLQADYVLCPSTDGEGSSGVIKEGMAAGKTVIASDLTANKELIDHQVNGLLFKNYDSDSLRQTLEQAIGKEVVIDQQEISKKVALFDCQNTIEQYITLYRQFKQD